METRLSKQEEFLSDKVRDNDAALLTVTASLGNQVLRARVIKIYSARKGMQRFRCGEEIDFVYGSSVYGNTALLVGETAVVFLTDISGILHEDSWRGHMVVEDIEGVPHAIFPHLAVSADPASPASRAVQDPKRAYARAIAFAELETYLLELIAKANKS